MVEDVAFCPGLVGLVVKSIQEKVFIHFLYIFYNFFYVKKIYSKKFFYLKLLTMNLPSDVALYAFDVLKDFVGLYEYVQRDSKVCVKNFFNVGFVCNIYLIYVFRVKYFLELCEGAGISFFTEYIIFFVIFFNYYLIY